MPIRFRRSSHTVTRSPTQFIGYAITEVALLVCGILLALAINNWNEERKRQERLASILQVVQSDLRGDINSITEVQNHYQQLAPYFELLKSGELTRATYEETPLYAGATIGYPQLYLHRRGFHLLEAFPSKEGGREGELINGLIRFFYQGTQDVLADDKFRAREQQENFSHWKETQPWWADFLSGKGRDAFIDYALDDPDYRNRAMSFEFFHYRVFLPEALEYGERAKQQLAQINAFLSAP
jgi:hypothetical protein